MEIENRLNIWKIPAYVPWYRIDKKVAHFFRKIKWTWQRSSKGFCDCDTWSLDYTLGNYIAVTVKHLKETTHGYPLNSTEKEWEETLDSISRSFYLAVNEDLWDNPYEEDFINSDIGSNKEISEKYIGKEMENCRAREIRLQEGVGLLRKWFFNLWD